MSMWFQFWLWWLYLGQRTIDSLILKNSPKPVWKSQGRVSPQAYTSVCILIAITGLPKFFIFTDVLQNFYRYIDFFSNLKSRFLWIFKLPMSYINTTGNHNHPSNGKSEIWSSDFLSSLNFGQVGLVTCCLLSILVKSQTERRTDR